MIKINSTANGFVVEGVDSPFYPYEGKLTFPSNEVVVETEEDTEMALFRSASNFDVLFSGLIEEITIDGQAVTKDNIHEKFSAVANAQAGGGEGGMTPEEKQELKDVRADVERALGEIAELDYDKAEKSDVYTKEEVDEKIAQGGGYDLGAFTQPSAIVYANTLYDVDFGTHQRYTIPTSSFSLPNKLNIGDKIQWGFVNGSTHVGYAEFIVLSIEETVGNYQDAYLGLLSNYTDYKLSYMQCTWNGNIKQWGNIILYGENFKTEHYTANLSQVNSDATVELSDKEVTKQWVGSQNFDLMVTVEGNESAYNIIGEPTFDFDSVRGSSVLLTSEDSDIWVEYYKDDGSYYIYENNSSSTWRKAWVYVNDKLEKGWNQSKEVKVKAGDKVLIHTPIDKNTPLSELDTIIPDVDIVKKEEQTGTEAITVTAYISEKGSVKLTVGDKEVVTKDELDTKQDKLTAGEGITIEDNVISATGGSGAGGDEHYKSEVTEGMDDAPVMTMVNGTKTMVTQNPQGQGNAPIEAVGATYEDSKDLVLKKDRYTSTPTLYVNEMGGGMQYQVATWNSSEGCLVFNNEYFGNYYLSTTIWYVNGEVIKEAGSYNFISGKKIHVYDEWNKDGDKLRIVDPGRWFDSWTWDVMFGFVATTVESLEPYEQKTYKSIDNAMEIDYRGNKYHLNPKENFKTINGQSIIGTGNLTVTDSNTLEYYDGRSIAIGSYYKIQGDVINKWDAAKTNATDYSNYVKGHVRYNSSQSKPSSLDRNISINRYTEKESVVKLTAYTNAFRINTADVRNAEPTYIAKIDGSSLTRAEIFARGNEYYGYGSIYITPDNKLVIDDVNHVHNEWSQYVYLDVYVSDTKDGDYTMIRPTQLTLQGGTTTTYQAVALEAEKWYKIIYSVDDIGGQDYSLFDFYSNFQNKGSVEVLAKGWVETDIDDSLYYQHGSELTPILTQKNISKYVDINGGGADLSNYPTKQEVNQTYLQKQGEYVKSVTASGGSINFAKGNGTDDVVNLKTIGGQSIIGMDDIAVPTAQENNIGTDKNYIWSSGDLMVNGDLSANTRYNVLAGIKLTFNSKDSVQMDMQNWGNTRSFTFLPTATTNVAGFMSGDDKNKLDALPTVWKGTQSEYDALGSHDDNTLYLITE